MILLLTWFTGDYMISFRAEGGQWPCCNPAAAAYYLDPKIMSIEV